MNTISHSSFRGVRNSQQCRSDIFYCVRNYLLEVIQRARITLIGSFFQVNPPPKKKGGFKSRERCGQMILEITPLPKNSVSTFTVSLVVWQVAPSSWNQQSVNPFLTKPQTAAQYLCTQHHLQWIKENRGPTILHHTKRRFSRSAALLRVRYGDFP